MFTFPVVSASALEAAARDQPKSHATLRECSLRLGALTLDPDRRRAAVDGRDAGLSAAEFALLYLLVTRRGVAMSKQAITDALLASAPATNIVDVWVLRLRSKLAKAGFTGGIATVWGRGYTIAGPGDAGPSDEGAHPMMPPRSSGVRSLLAPS